MFRPNLISQIFLIKPPFSQNLIKPIIHNNFTLNSLFNRSLVPKQKVIKKEKNNDKFQKEIEKDRE